MKAGPGKTTCGSIGLETVTQDNCAASDDFDLSEAASNSNVHTKFRVIFKNSSGSQLPVE